MANKSYKKAVVFGLCLAMLTPLGSMAVTSADAEEDTAAVEETVEETVSDDAATSDDEDKLPDKISNEQAADMAEKLSENDKFILYGDEENGRLGLYVKETDKYWWTSPINVFADDIVVDPEKGDMMKTALRKQIASSCAIKVGDLRQEKRTESAAPVYSNKAKTKWKTNDKGAVIHYDYKSEGVEFDVHYELCEDSLYVYVDTAEIKEDNISTVDGKILTKLQLCPYFAATPSVDYEGNPTEGYMIIPDGSGAVINYNNGKGNYPDYVQQIYGRDYTMVPLTAPRVTEQAYLPVISTVYGSAGIVAVVTDGDSNVYARAQVSGQNKQVYNNCYFEFETRSSDAFFMSGDSANKLNVFEKDGIKTERFGIHYYPVQSKDGGMVNYADCAEVYRNYLIKEKGLTQKDTSKNELYLDMYGGVLKRTSILGLPFNLKTEITGFKQAGEIIDKLKEQQIDDMIIDYNDWTNKSITNKISTKAKASGTLGGDKDFKDVLSTDGVKVYPSMNNNTMDSSSWGYMTLTSTAIRISNAYSRQSKYSYAFGVAEVGVSPALLSPSRYNDVFDEMISSYKDESIENIGFGDFSYKLSSDFSSKNTSSRDKTMNTIIEGYKKAKEEMGGVITDATNAYVLPFASNITNVPVYSSGFNVTDYDIPFYQMVIHGYVPYAGTPINASSNSDEMFMLSLAAGSNIHYDMIYEDSSVLADTDYDELYYANYEGWVPHAAKEYELTKQILSGVSDMTIKKYERSSDGNELKTTYTDGSKDVVVRVNLKAYTATVDGTTYDLSPALSEGGSNG